MKRLFSLIFALALALPALAQSTQTKTASTATGGTGWNNPTLAEVTDQTYATNTITNNTFTTDLCLSNYNFTITSGSTINGISVAILGHTTSNGAVDLGTTQGGSAVQITKVAGTRAGTVHTSTTNWTSTDTTFTLGSSSDLWGLTWATSDTNSSGFGVCVSMENNAAAGGNTAQVDSVIITVTFTLPPAGFQFLKMFSQTREPGLVFANQQSVSIRQPLIVPTRNGMFSGVAQDMPVLMAESISNSSGSLMAQPLSIAASDFEVDVRVARTRSLFLETLRQSRFPVRGRDNEDRPFGIANMDKLKCIFNVGGLAPVGLFTVNLGMLGQRQGAEQQTEQQKRS